MAAGAGPSSPLIRAGRVQAGPGGARLEPAAVCRVMPASPQPIPARQQPPGRQSPRRPVAALLAPALCCLLGAPSPAAAAGEVQLRCDGTLLEARGTAELERQTRRLRVNLGLEAEAADADAALAALQSRLAAVRSALQRLGVEELRVSSPSTWRRPVEAGRPARFQASLQVSGRLAPARLQALIRGVGGLPGVQLSPVGSEADPGDDPAVRRQLLQAAYRDALAQARELAAVIGRSQLTPLEVLVDGNELRPVMMRAMADAAPPPFNPAELPKPKDRLSLLVRFCVQ